MRIWAFVVAIAYWPGIYGAPFMPRWWAIALGLPIVCRIDPRNLAILFMALVAIAMTWGAATLIWTPHLYGGTLQLIFIVLLAGVAIAASQTHDFDSVMEWFCAGIGLSAVLAVFQKVGWFDLLPQQSHLPGGLFFSSEVLGELAAPALVWAIAKRRLAPTLLLIIPIILCQSRIAFLALSAGMLLVWQPVHRPWLKRVLVGVAWAIVGFAMLFLKMASADQRVLLWATAVRSITPGGSGLGWWEAAHPFPFEQYAHSDFLQALVEIGLGGVALAGAGVWLLYKGKGDVATRAAFLACLVETAVSFPLHLPANGFLVALLAGHLARRRAVVYDCRSALRTSSGISVGAGTTYGERMETARRYYGDGISL